MGGKVATKCGPGNLLKIARTKKKEKGKKKRLGMGWGVGQEDAVGVEALHGWFPDREFDARAKALRKLTEEHGCRRVIEDLQLAAGGARPGTKLRTNGFADARWVKMQPECRYVR